MIAVLKRKMKPRLARLARLPGGKTVGAIEADVLARLDALKDTCFVEAQLSVARMTELAAALPQPPEPDDLRPFYGLCDTIVGLAGVAELAHAGRAALSLCRLLDGWIAGRPWRPASLDVCLTAIALLCRPDCGLAPEERDKIVAGLVDVARRPGR
ncbi:MAG TPA: hypothetical protein VGM25_01130 [Caulobacteraceae bacterium]|jgi:hypothetical protein